MAQQTKGNKKPQASATKPAEAKETKPVVEQAPVVEKKQVYRTLRKVSPDELVDVQSCTYGNMLYISKRTGNRVEWEDFGDIQTMTVGELQIMKGSQPLFFERKLIMIVGENAKDVIDYLQLNKYYADFGSIDEIDAIFEASPEEIKRIVANLPDKAIETIARRAYALIENGTIDSQRVINALQDSLGYELVHND